ncbi:MAG TPA: hypothetical protein VFN39_07700 [Gemmatimonadaceae bacterium]|nr:hypothetical protein [Gemmatimonadaceae bacterium]
MDSHSEPVQQLARARPGHVSGVQRARRLEGKDFDLLGAEPPKEYRIGGSAVAR